MTNVTAIPDDRLLTDAEVALVKWLLQHGVPSATDYLPQLDQARVASRCYCGCASVNFSVDGIVPSPGSMEILADFEWQAVGGEMFGVFVFAHHGLLAGLDVWSQDGLAEAKALPKIEYLRPKLQEFLDSSEG